MIAAQNRLHLRVERQRGINAAYIDQQAYLRKVFRILLVQKALFTHALGALAAVHQSLDIEFLERELLGSGMSPCHASVVLLVLVRELIHRRDRHGIVCIAPR